MNKLLLAFLLFSGMLFSQHAAHLEQHRFDTSGVVAAPKPSMPKVNCTLNKTTFGWHPYWMNGAEVNYDWSLLSDLCFFGYEVDPATGNATSTHGWSTNNAVTQALANGTKVHLCVTLFSSHATFFGSSTAQTTLINNLVNLVQTRGAHGVNIDFEGVPASQSANLTTFMTNLGTALHGANPNYKLSICLYAVDWNNVFNEAVLVNSVDMFTIMGYDYYYSGSSQAGPTDPLYSFTTGYDYSLSRSVSYYLNAGIPANKLILGLPYYGREWETSSNAIPSATTGNNIFSRTFDYVKTNSTGLYTNPTTNVSGSSKGYIFQNAGTWRQCWVTEANEMRERFDLVNRRGLKGIGIWALGYDDGFNDFWLAIDEKLTDCNQWACSDTLYDEGGPSINYYNNELVQYTIAPPGASYLNVNFLEFATEANYDTLWLYDGPSTSSPLIGFYHGNIGPGSFSTTSGQLTIKFKSDGSTRASGWKMVYECVQDQTPPTTAISTPPTWVTQNFTSNFTDADNAGGSGIEKSYYQVIDYDGTDWRANATKGFFSDNFDQATIHPDWTSQTGTWATSNSYLVQSDEANTNTNLWASVNHSLSNRYLYHWAGKMGGTGTNRRAGMHYFCSDPTLPNRGNSYFVFFRLDNDKVQLYEVANDVFTLVNEVTYDFNVDQWYDFKVIYDRISGKHQVYVDNVKVTSWTDATPLSSGDYISFRSGNSVYTVNDLKVYRSRAASVNITVGPTEMLRYQSANPTTQAGRIKSIVQDTVGNLSSIVSQDVYVDWTAPLDLTFVNDGTAADISSTTNSNLLEANWSLSSDPHSDVAHNWYSIGTSPGATDVVNWTDNYWNTSVSVGGLSLSIGTTYYVNVKIENGAGLFSAVVSSNGQQVVAPIDPAVASFVSQNTTACAGSTISFSNSSTNATSYEWTFTGATPSTSTAVSPDVVFPATGTYTVQLIAVGPGGNDTLTQSISVTISQPVNAVFAVSNDTLILPNTLVTMTNTSQNANGYFWDFGDGSSSTDAQPYHNYASAGTYTVTLTAANDACPQDTATVQIVVLDVTGVGEYSVFEAVFPNPSSDQVVVKTVKNDVALTVRDMNGKVIWVGKTQDGMVTISVKTWSKGVYYLSSEGGEVMEIVVR